MQNIHEIIYAPPNGTVGAQTTYAASTVMLTYTPSRPVRIIRWGTIVTTAPVSTNTTTLQFQGNIWPTANVNTNAIAGATTSIQATGYNSSNSPLFYVDTAGGTLTIANALLVSPATVPIGSVLWHNVNPQAAQTGGYYPAPDTALIPPGGVATQLVIYPGQSFVINCVAVPNSVAGAGKFFLEVEEQAFVADYNNNPMVVTGYPSGNGTTPTPSWPFAVASFNAQS